MSCSWARKTATWERRAADILHSELDRAHPDDEHHLLLVGGRTARQRHKKRHVPQALEAVAAFIGEKV